MMEDMCAGQFLDARTEVQALHPKKASSRSILKVFERLLSVFRILKKRWQILEYGVCFRNIKVVEKVFVVCCMLHNMMLSDMETQDTSYHVGCQAPLGHDAI